MWSAPLLALFISLVGAPRASQVAAPRASQEVPAPPTSRAPGTSDATTERAAEHQALHKSFIAAWSRYQQALNAAREKGAPKSEWPTDPSTSFYARFEELAERGEAGALRWCIDHARAAGLDADATRRRTLELYRRLVELHPDDDWMADVAADARRAHAAKSLDLELALSVCREIGAATRNAKVARQALYNQALIWSQSPEAGHADEALKLFEALIAEHPGTDVADRARGKITQVKALRVGLTAPDFETADVDGASFKLSDFRGKVVALVFWGFWCAPCRAMLPHEKALAERFVGRPFALVGVNTDSDKDAFRAKAHEHGVTWRTSWQGSTSGEWCKAWGVTTFPTVYVLDAHGVIRHLNLRGEALERAVEELVLEREAEVRSPAPRGGVQDDGRAPPDD